MALLSNKHELFKVLNLILQYKLRKQEYSDLNWEFEVWSFLFYQLNYTLFKLN